MLEGYLSRVDYECEWMDKRMKVEKSSAIGKGLKSRAKPSHLRLVEEARVEEVVLLNRGNFDLQIADVDDSKAVTWLILPVVICLSQRLSHACLRMNASYCETANGSLNQL